ncbi:MAG: PHP domain-containing protein [Clostridiaceae bacterium]|jgi:predicted metal-dependent phosphoesterase TrpH|nr:PHP domain-containing protein [Clostridiaceae bacterium]
MKANFHIHTSFSTLDGEQSPTKTFETMAEHGITVAAITDHDNVNGCAEAREACARLGIEYYDGIELTVQPEGSPLPDFDSIFYIHVLGLGVNPAKIGKLNIFPPFLTFKQGIDLIHNAGGLAVWAHPLWGPSGQFHNAETEILAGILKDLGIDGMEVYYAHFSDENLAFVEKIADRLKLLKSTGTDYHGAYGAKYLKNSARLEEFAEKALPLIERLRKRK